MRGCVLFVFGLAVGVATACTEFYVGRDVSADGTVLIARTGNRGTCDTVGVIRLMEIGVARDCD